jgi:hypothetical protein
MEARKWADYAITEVEIRNDNGAGLGAPRRVTRQAIVDALDRGETCVTAFRTADGNFHRGEDVRVVNTTHGRFIRTDRDNILADNLNKLPEYN